MARSLIGRPPSRGGARQGAGRKPLGAEPMQRHQVLLDAASERVLRMLGNGNLSAGIRASARLAADKAAPDGAATPAAPDQQDLTRRP